MHKLFFLFIDLIGILPAAAKKQGGEDGVDQEGEKQNLGASIGPGGRLGMSAQFQEQNLRQRFGPRWR